VSPLDPLVAAIADAVIARLPKTAPVVSPLPRFLTYSEAAEQLRCSERQVRVMCDSGKLRRVYPDGCSGMPRVPRSELDRIERGAKA
jgi:excisionase family DNA binding protein